VIEELRGLGAPRPVRAVSEAAKLRLMDRFNIDEKFALFSETWRPKVVAALNGQEVKVIKVQGVFPWHTHEREDEMFLVWKGTFRVEFRDRVVTLSPGDCVVVPRGVEHRTAADELAEVLVFEPAEVRNTGDVEDPVYTAPQGVRL
jgi:mannose-6-phosphate isomerase-like protein (cupin superfamily)